MERSRYSNFSDPSMLNDCTDTSSPPFELDTRGTAILSLPPPLDRQNPSLYSPPCQL